MTTNEYGKWIPFPFMGPPCPECDRLPQFPPGELNDDQTVETRACPEDGCKGSIETTPYFTAPPGEATTDFSD